MSTLLYQTPSHQLMSGAPVDGIPGFRRRGHTYPSMADLDSALASS
jgi:hypothetical protein